MNKALVATLTILCIGQAYATTSVTQTVRLKGGSSITFNMENQPLTISCEKETEGPKPVCTIVEIDGRACGSTWPHCYTLYMNGEIALTLLDFNAAKNELMQLQSKGLCR